MLPTAKVTKKPEPAKTVVKATSVSKAPAKKEATTAKKDVSVNSSGVPVLSQNKLATPKKEVVLSGNKMLKSTSGAKLGVKSAVSIVSDPKTQAVEVKAKEETKLIEPEPISLLDTEEKQEIPSINIDDKMDSGKAEETSEHSKVTELEVKPSSEIQTQSSNINGDENNNDNKENIENSKEVGLNIQTKSQIQTEPEVKVEIEVGAKAEKQEVMVDMSEQANITKKNEEMSKNDNHEDRKVEHDMDSEHIIKENTEQSRENKHEQLKEETELKVEKKDEEQDKNENNNRKQVNDQQEEQEEGNIVTYAPFEEKNDENEMIIVEPRAAIVESILEQNTKNTEKEGNDSRKIVEKEKEAYGQGIQGTQPYMAQQEQEGGIKPNKKKQNLASETGPSENLDLEVTNDIKEIDHKPAKKPSRKIVEEDGTDNIRQNNNITTASPVQQTEHTPKIENRSKPEDSNESSTERYDDIGDEDEPRVVIKQNQEDIVVSESSFTIE